MAHFWFQPMCGRQFHDLKTQLQLSASHFEGVLRGFLCSAPEAPAKPWKLELVWLVQSYSGELGNQYTQG